MKLREKVTDMFRGEGNPVLLKELRQAVRSKFIIGIIYLYLVALIAGLALFLFGATVDRALNSSENPLGLYLYTALMGVLWFAAILIPNYAAWRLNSEKNENKIDMLFITCLTPGQIVRGKFYGSMSLTILLVSLSLPFMVFCYLLRGIDIPAILSGCGSLLLFSAMFNSLALFVGAIPGNKMFKSLLRIGSVMGSIWILFPVLASISMMRHGMGAGAISGGKEFWAAAGYLFLTTISITTLFYVFTVIVLSPLHSNRFMPLRLLSTVLWTVWGFALIIPAYVMKEEDFFFIWSFFAIFTVCIISVVSIGEEENHSIRLRSKIPRFPLFRLPVFPFYSGPVNGLCWSIIHIAGTLLVISLVGVKVITGRHVGFDKYEELLRNSLVIFSYFICYVLTARLMQRKIFQSVAMKSGVTIVLTILIFSMSVLFPGLLEFLDSVKNIDKVPEVFYGCMLAGVYDKEQVDTFLIHHLVFAGIWSGLLILLQMKWIAKEICSFSPPPKEIDSDDRERKVSFSDTKAEGSA